MKKLFVLGITIFTLATSSCKSIDEQLKPILSTDADAQKPLVITMAQYNTGVSKSGSGPHIQSVSSEIVFSYDNRNVRVKAYSRNVGDTKNSPVFKYSDLLNRAIAYKNAHPDTAVKVKFAMYEIGMNAYVGFNPSDATTYGYVKGSDFGGDNSEKMAYSIVKAALNQVSVDFVYQFNESDDVYSYINSFMEKPCLTDSTKKVKDYLRIRQVNWGTSSYQQMHAKFMTVNHFAGDSGDDVANTVYSTSANVDDHNSTGIPAGRDWVQSGMLINGHAELMASFNTYFDVIYSNYNNQANFQSQIRSMHTAHSLNYDDMYFSSYFFPIPSSPAGIYTAGKSDSSNVQGNAWDVNYNPVAKYVSQMATTSGNRYLKVNMYHLKMDNFGMKLYQELSAIYNGGTTGSKEFHFLAQENSFQSTRPLSVFNNIGAMHYPKETHTKDITFALSGTTQYYTITGSTNLKLDDYTSKANSSLVVKEFTTAHPVYNAYKDIFNYQY